MLPHFGVFFICVFASSIQEKFWLIFLTMNRFIIYELSQYFWCFIIISWSSTHFFLLQVFNDEQIHQQSWSKFFLSKGFSFIAQRCAGVVIDCVFKVVINLSVHTRIQFYSSELFKFCYHLLFQCRRFVHNLYFITFKLYDLRLF